MARSWTKCYVCGQPAPELAVAKTDPKGTYQYQIPRDWYIDESVNGVLCKNCHDLKKACSK